MVDEGRQVRGGGRAARVALAAGIAAAGLAAPGVARAAHPSEAVVVTCFDRTATKVGTRRGDVLKGTKGTDVLVGLAGNDILVGNGGSDYLCGGPGKDKLYGGARPRRPHRGPLAHRVVETTDLDRLTGEAGNDTLIGGPGDDFLTGGRGNDTLDGGVGGAIDTLFYNNSPHAVTVNLGTGRASGEGRDRVLRAEAAVGSNFNDRLVGGRGTNFLIGIGGDDVLAGADGSDYAAFLTTPVEASLVVAQAVGEGRDTLDSIEDLAGSSGADTLVGDGGPNEILGGGGDDVMIGGAGADALAGDLGNDTLQGAEGSDALSGQGGDDRLDGGDGDDTGVYLLDGQPVVADLGAGSATGSGKDSLAALESLAGSQGNDTLIGDNGPNLMFGFGGNDQLVGGGASDFVGGGSGADGGDAGPGSDYCLDDESVSRCEANQRPGGSSASFSLARPLGAASVSRALAASIGMGRVGAYLRRLGAETQTDLDTAPAPRLPAQAITTADLVSYGRSPSCAASGTLTSTTVLPPSYVIPDIPRVETVRWRATLFRQDASTGQFVADRATGMLRARLGAVVAGSVRWANTSGAAVDAITVPTQQGKYAWRGEVVWEATGRRYEDWIEPHDNTHVGARFQPVCDFSVAPAP